MSQSLTLRAGVVSLAIFGLKSGDTRVAALTPPKVLERPPLPPGQHEIRGTVRKISGTTLVVEKRDGKTMTVDLAKAAAHYKAAPPSVGHALVARGTMEGDAMKADLVGHVPDHVQVWPPDR